MADIFEDIWSMHKGQKMWRRWCIT